jgi:hypothetical protein
VEHSADHLTRDGPCDGRMQHGPRGAHCLMPKSTARGSARQGGAARSGPGVDTQHTRHGTQCRQWTVAQRGRSPAHRSRPAAWSLNGLSGTVYSSVWYPRTRTKVILYRLVTDWGPVLVQPSHKVRRRCIALPLTEPSTRATEPIPRGSAGVSTPCSPSARSRGLSAQTSSTRGHSCGGTR